MILRNVIFSLCMIILLVSSLMVFFSDGFSRWENKEVAGYYVSEGSKETGALNIVSSIVWGFRGFDTLGEETVLFTAAVGVFTIIIFGLKNFRKRKMG